MLYHVVADVHFGNLGVHPGQVISGLNDRFREIAQVFTQVRNPQTPREDAALVVAGDLFDTSRPSPQMLRAVGDLIRDNFAEAHLVLGNHDQHSDAALDNALAVLELVPRVTVYTVPTYLGPFLFLPYGYDFRDVPVVEPGTQVAVAHHGIRDDSMAAWTRDKGAPVEEVAAWLEATGLTHYLAGDWHPRRSWWQGRIQQIGALSPKDWSNPGTDPYGTVLEVSDGQELIPGTSLIGPRIRRRIIPGPRFVVSKSTTDQFVSPHVTHWYIRTTYPRHHREFPPNSTLDDAPEVVDAEAQVRTVASHLSDTESLPATVAAYIDQDSSIPSTLKAKVHAACQKLLRV